MTSQSFFFITAGSAIVLVAIFCVVLIIVAIIIAVRVAKISRNISKASEKVSGILDAVREKIKYSAVAALFTRGLEELVSFIKEKREQKKKKK